MLEKLNPWSPITDPLKLKILGKAIEEATEYGSALARCVVQGIDEAEPTTGKVNKRWLEEEGADVMATLALAIEHLGLDHEFMHARAQEKVARLQTWFDMPVKET